MIQRHCTRQHLARSCAQPLFLLLGALIATAVQAATHFVTFINDSDRTVTSIETAPAGTHRWHDLDLGGPLIGGGSGQAAVRFDDAKGCKQDLMVIYRGMSPLTITGFNVCRSERLYLGKALAEAWRSIQVP